MDGTPAPEDESPAPHGAAPERPERVPRRWGLVALVTATWVGMDQLTKHWAVNALTDRDIDLVGSLRFNLAFNRGMAFSRGEGFGPVIAVLAIALVIGLLLGLRTTGSRTATIATGVVVGGGLGNLVDRLFRQGGGGFLEGAVVDFIDVQWWPIFNVADIGITCGAVVLLVSAWKADRDAATPTRPATPPSGDPT